MTQDEKRALMVCAACGARTDLELLLGQRPGEPGLIRGLLLLCRAHADQYRAGELSIRIGVCPKENAEPAEAEAEGAQHG